MAKPKNNQIAPSATDANPQDATETPADDGGAEGGDIESAEPEQLEQEEDPGRPKVKALVLSDSIYGKCGEVKEFPADKVEAIAAAGYIDAHPNAVKSVEG